VYVFVSSVFSLVITIVLSVEVRLEQSLARVYFFHRYKFCCLLLSLQSILLCRHLAMKLDIMSSEVTLVFFFTFADRSVFVSTAVLLWQYVLVYSFLSLVWYIFPYILYVKRKRSDVFLCVDIYVFQAYKQ
jgi:hypothetical protein